MRFNPKQLQLLDTWLQVEDFIHGAQLEHLPNLSFWAGALKMVRIVERPIEADDVKPNLARHLKINTIS